MVYVSLSEITREEEEEEEEKAEKALKTNIRPTSGRNRRGLLDRMRSLVGQLLKFTILVSLC